MFLFIEFNTLFVVSNSWCRDCCSVKAVLTTLQWSRLVKVNKNVNIKEDINISSHSKWFDSLLVAM